MTAPEATLTTEQSLRLYMTPAGYDLAVGTFGADMVRAVAAQHTDLRLAAAELLEGLPNQSGEVSGLSSFKLDVLEFKFQSGKAVSTSWVDIATRLRQQVAAGPPQPRRRFANPAPTVDPWGLG